MRKQAEISIILYFADEYFAGDYLRIERAIQFM